VAVPVIVPGVSGVGLPTVTFKEVEEEIPQPFDAITVIEPF
jgi:hypothetical protein